jgi:hypothetical protein
VPDSKGSDRFLAALLDVVKEEVITPDLVSPRRIRASLSRDLFDEHDLLDEPQADPSEEVRVLTPRQQFLKKFFDGVVEITQSFEALKDIQLYIGRFPFRRSNVSRTRYLRYHFESYLQEVFLLEERLLGYLTWVRRAYRKDRRAGDFERVCNVLQESVRKTLKGIIDLRSTHVHQYRVPERTLDRLGTLELLLSAPTGDIVDHDFAEFIARAYRLRYLETKRHWKKTIKDNNSALRALLDLYFDQIYALCFDAQGKVLFPDSLRA